MSQLYIDTVLTIWVVSVLPALMVLSYFKLTRPLGALGGLVCLASLLLQPKLEIPVAGASKHDWHQESFWYEPWGASVVHRGIDIFGDHGQPVIAPTALLTVFSGSNGIGGEAVVAFDRSLRIHYFAHLSERHVKAWDWLGTGDRIGLLGSTGNAVGKPPHLHYSLASPAPQYWKMTAETRGHLRAFFLDPEEWFAQEGMANTENSQSALCQGRPSTQIRFAKPRWGPPSRCSKQNTIEIVSM